MRRILDFPKMDWAPWLLAAAVSACLSFLAVWFGGLNQDEGWYLYAAQMVRAGKLPFHDFFYTQGPAMPLVYSVLAPVWGADSPLRGLLGGRVVTLVLGFLATACAVALVRRLMEKGGVTWQMSELGRQEKGGGGTIAKCMARFGMDVLDFGTPLLNMHAPWELASKFDCYHTKKAYAAYFAG